MRIDWFVIVGELAWHAHMEGLIWSSDDTATPDEFNGIEWHEDQEAPVYRRCTVDSYSDVVAMLLTNLTLHPAELGSVEVDDRSIPAYAAAYASHAMTDDWYTCEAGNFISAILESLGGE